MVKRDRIPKDASPEFKAVMKGVRGDNPEHKRLEAKAKAKQKAVGKALAKRKGKHRGHGGDDVIDSGMFDS